MPGHEKRQWFKFFPQDWFFGVRGLARGQRGDYLDILCVLWMEGPLTDEELVKRVTNGGKTAAIRRTIEVLTATNRLLIDGQTRYYNPRMEEERKSASTRFLSQSEAGKKGAKKRWGTNGILRGDVDGDGDTRARARGTHVPPPIDFADSDGQAIALLKRLGFGGRRAEEIFRQLGTTAEDVEAWREYEKTHGTLAMKANVQTYKHPSEVPPEVDGDKNQHWSKKL